jgi:hypothetical protein
MSISLNDIDEKLKETINQFHDKDYVFLWYALSSEIILNALGIEWWMKYCHLESGIFVKINESEDKRYNGQNKIIFFGHLLYSLKGCDGFEIFVESLKLRDFDSCYWEMSVAERFLESGFKIKFIKETGIKGNDYDLTVCKDGLEFYVEAKNRGDNPNDEKALINVLNKARKQLPKNGYGIIYSLIPLKWTEKEGNNEIVVNIIETFLKNTTRVKFVVIDWHEWLYILPSGKALMMNSRIFKNTMNAIDYELCLKRLDPNDLKAFTPSYLKK